VLGKKEVEWNEGIGYVSMTDWKDNPDLQA
jgi:hypothetical protein